MANQLREKLLQFHEELIETSAVAAELDCLLSLTFAAGEAAGDLLSLAHACNSTGN